MREKLVLDVLDRKNSPDVLAKVWHEHVCQTLFRDDAYLYWREHYEATGKPKSLRGKVRQLEHLMREGDLGQRPSKNQRIFYDLRTIMRDHLERFLLESLGFQTLSR